MEQENMNRKDDERRQMMIDFIVRTIQQIDDRKLQNIYNIVLYIQ